MHLETDGCPATATLECLKASFFTSMQIPAKATTLQIIMNLDHPDIDLECTAKCGSSYLPLHIKGHLEYLHYIDMRSYHSDVHHEPMMEKLAKFRAVYRDFGLWVELSVKIR